MRLSMLDMRLSDAFGYPVRFSICVCVGLMRLRWTYAFALLSVVFFVMLDPIGDLFIEPLLTIVPYESVNFCLTFLVKYDKGGSSLDFLNITLLICLCKPFGYVFSVNDCQWKGFRIYGIIVFWCDLFVKCYTIMAPTDGKHQ